MPREPVSVVAARRAVPGRRLADAVGRHPGAAVAVSIVIVTVSLGLSKGWQELAQTTINGIVAGNYFALGAVGLTLIFGVLRLVNFAHGEFLTFGAYMLILGRSLGMPLVLA